MNTVTTDAAPAEPIDRDIPDLVPVKKKNNVTRLVTWGIVLLAIIIAVAGLTMFMNALEKNKQVSDTEKAKARPKAASLTTTSGADIKAAQARIEKQQETEDTAAAATAANSPAGGSMPVPADAIGVTPTGVNTAGSQPQSGSAPAGNGQATAASSTPAPRVLTRRERQLEGDVLIESAGKAASTFGDDGSKRSGQSGSGVGASLRNAVAGAADVAKNGLDEKVKPSALTAGKAGQRNDLSMLLLRGTSIPCGAVTAISSERAGAVTCVVANDVYSSDGKVLLIERGSKAFGEQREAMMQGQSRIAAIWSRIDTPYGVFVDVNSIATDPLGRGGIAAEVDNHLGQRFGGAVLLSLIGDFGQAAANSANNSGGTIQFGNTSTAGQELASKTLEHTINIPPTGYVHQGAATTITVLRDMDFRGVYELARK